MKKLLIALTIVISCLGINKVSAESLYLEDMTEENFTVYKNEMGVDNFNTIIDKVINKYKTDYIDTYPYFYIAVSFQTWASSINEDYHFLITLNCYKEIPVMNWYMAVSGNIILTRATESDISYSYNYPVKKNSSIVFSLDNFEESSTTHYNDPWQTNILSLYSEDSDIDVHMYKPYSYYISNFDMYIKPISSSTHSSYFVKNYDTLMIPELGEDTLYHVHSYTKNDFLVEPYYLYDEDVNVTLPDYTEINLNDYAYVALALKDYNNPKTFETTVQVKGQYCITPLYEYGTKTYDSVTSTKVQNVCSPYYSNYTPVRTYITFDNFKNNAIYYVKAYDTSRDNYIKIDNKVFDITYISEEDKDNPYVYVQGKYYPTISYDNLPSSATQNTEEGYIPGQVEEFSFADIFTAPLEFLKDIWSSIVSVFDLVKEFISLLPEPIPTFLFSSFMLAVALGLLKIIL